MHTVCELSSSMSNRHEAARRKTLNIWQCTKIRLALAGKTRELFNFTFVQFAFALFPFFFRSSILNVIYSRLFCNRNSIKLERSLAARRWNLFQFRFQLFNSFVCRTICSFCDYSNNRLFFPTSRCFLVEEEERKVENREKCEHFSCNNAHNWWVWVRVHLQSASWSCDNRRTLSSWHKSKHHKILEHRDTKHSTLIISISIVSGDETRLLYGNDDYDSHSHGHNSLYDGKLTVHHHLCVLCIFFFFFFILNTLVHSFVVAVHFQEQKQ